MTGAGEALVEAAATALHGVAGIGRVYDAPPLQASVPYALVEADLVTDWGHKSGAGREVRLAALLHDQGERPVRLRALASAAETALERLTGDVGGGWRLVSMRLLRTRIVRTRSGGWTAAIEFRARLLAA